MLRILSLLLNLWTDLVTGSDESVSLLQTDVLSAVVQADGQMSLDMEADDQIQHGLPSGSHFVVRGNPSLDWSAWSECLDDGDTSSASITTAVDTSHFADGYTLGTTCCEDSNSITAVRPNCSAHGVTFQQARSICIQNGMDLCTKAQLKSRISVSTGCEFDRIMNWVSDACDGTVHCANEVERTSNRILGSFDHGTNPAAGRFFYLCHGNSYFGALTSEWQKFNIRYNGTSGIREGTIEVRQGDKMVYGRWYPWSTVTFEDWVYGDSMTYEGAPEVATGGRPTVGDIVRVIATTGDCGGHFGTTFQIVEDRGGKHPFKAQDLWVMNGSRRCYFNEDELFWFGN